MAILINRLFVVPIFALQLLIFWTVSSYALDQRIVFKKTDFSENQIAYRLVSLESDPLAWDGQDPSEEEVAARFSAERFLFEIQTFLTETHTKNGKRPDGDELQRLILQSFQQYPDPLGRLAFTDAGRTSHKIDDYLENKCLVLAIYRKVSEGRWEILGTLKFVVNDRIRLHSPDLNELRGFIPLAIGAVGESQSSKINIEYENLVRRDEGPSPVKALLKYAISSNFFRSIDSSQWGSIFLNAEGEYMANYHRPFGFQVISGSYEGLGAARMKTEIATFVKAVQGYVAFNSSKGRQIHLPEVSSQPLHFNMGFCKKSFTPGSVFLVDEL